MGNFAAVLKSNGKSFRFAGATKDYVECCILDCIFDKKLDNPEIEWVEPNESDSEAIRHHLSFLSLRQTMKDSGMLIA